MGSRQRRDEWTEFVRRRAAVLGGRVSDRARRLWTPAVRRGARAAAWVAIAVLLAPCVVCGALAAQYNWRAHYLAGVPIKHHADRQDGQPGYRPNGQPVADHSRTPMTEDEFRAWEENMDASRRWGRRAAASFPAGALGVLLIGCLTGEWRRTGPASPNPPRRSGRSGGTMTQGPGARGG